MCVFFFNDTATTEIYTLSLHDALPISWYRGLGIATLVGVPADVGAVELLFTSLLLQAGRALTAAERAAGGRPGSRDRKSTRLNPSHANISYAVFCLKKKNTLPAPARPH